MAYTMQQVADKARIPLNDASKVRYPDTDMLGYANDAILLLRSNRPDLFFGSFLTPPGAKVLGDNIPVDDTLFPALCDYVTARAATKDSDNELEKRAVMFFALFKGQI